jgi:hypothetical protein
VSRVNTGGRDTIGDEAGAPLLGRPGRIPGSMTGSKSSAGRMVAVALVIGLTLAAGYAAGRAGRPQVAPIAAAPAPIAHANHGPGGLHISQGGYTVALEPPTLAAGRDGKLVFRIVGPSGEAVKAFQRTHERLMHLVVVSRDLTDYQHLHPTMDLDGTWRATVKPTRAGPYRAIADFQPVGVALPVTLGTDVPVPGSYAPRKPPPDEETIRVDGYTVTLDGGLRPGESSQLLAWLGRDGKPVDDLQPHLGAYGHLVALRHGDLAYLHVHPAPEASPSSVVAFSVQVPSPGTYRLFFEFRHTGVVHVAAFNQTAF